MKDKMSAKLSLKSGFAGNHLRVAMKNALSACEVDEANKNSEFGPWFDDLMMHVPVAVVMSAAALEANVNEIIGRCIDNSSAFSESQVALIRDLKKDKSGSIMPKYRQLALLLGKIPDTGSAAWANAVLLAQARNRFIHFSPAWDHETDIHDGEFVNQLKARVQVSRFYANSFMFPYGFMTYSFAKWAIEVALAFSQEYSALLGIKDGLAGWGTLP